MSKPIRLVIVDDHQLFREGIQALLRTESDIQCVGEAADGQTAINLIQKLKPDVVLMDIDMPNLNGIQATKQLQKSDNQAGIVMLTMLEDNASIFAAMKAGARGYILKGADNEEMLSVIRAVAKGQALFSPNIASRIIKFFQLLDKGHTSQTDLHFPDLTDREREVLALMANGKNNREIAAHLVISEKTVRNHITNIYNKLQVADRTQAILKARDAGIG